MSTIQCRGSIAWAAVVVVLLCSTPADAQVGVDPGPPREPGGLVNNVVTGVEYDILNQAKAERRLEKVQGKISRDAERCDSAAVDRDARRIKNLQYRIVVDEWLIRWNSRQYAGCYPHALRLDPISCAALAQATSPAQIPYHPQSFPTPGPMYIASTITITIANAEPAGAGINFAIDGIAHQSSAGSRQDLYVNPNSIITYDGGGSIGQRRYQLSAGLYQFRSTAEGWALYKLPSTP